MEEADSRFDLSAGELALDFANSWRDRDGQRAELGYRELLEWSRAAAVVDAEDARQLSLLATQHPEEAAAVVQAAFDLGGSIQRVFHRLAGGEDPADADLEGLNRALAAALPKLRLSRGARCCTWTWSGPDDALDRMLWPIARAAADLLTSEQLDRVRECASPTCSWLFLDGSRNRSRKWCDMTSCGNRAKARRHYRRNHPKVTGSPLALTR